jgi:hypothetical protein
MAASPGVRSGVQAAACGARVRSINERNNEKLEWCCRIQAQGVVANLLLRKSTAWLSFE